MKKILTAILCMTLSLSAFAQSANLLSMARSELTKRGLEESEVRTRLMEEGIDVDSIPPSEYASYQGRVMDIINRMQAEKAGLTAVAGPDSLALNLTDSLYKSPKTTVGEAAAEVAAEIAVDEKRGAAANTDEIYGHSLFT